MFASRLPGTDYRAQASTIAHWHRSAWKLLRLAPLGVLLPSFVPILFEGVIQWSVPGGGVALSKVLTPLVVAWTLALLHLRVEQGRWRPGAASRLLHRRWRALPWIVALSLAAFVVQLAAAAVLSGPQDAVALLQGDAAALQMGGIMLARVLAIGAALMLALLFLPPLLLIDGHAIGPALRRNLAAIRGNAAAVVVVGIVWIALLMSAIVQPLLMLVLFPYGTLVVCRMARGLPCAPRPCSLTRSTPWSSMRP